MKARLQMPRVLLVLSDRCNVAKSSCCPPGRKFGHSAASTTAVGFSIPFGSSSSDSVSTPSNAALRWPMMAAAISSGSVSCSSASVSVSRSHAISRSSPALNEYVEHFHAERNHQGKGNVLLFPRRINIRRGHVQCRERLGGLLRYYHQEAA
jgi:hypothetical protein